MISRRLLRVKSLKLLFGNTGSVELNMPHIDKELQVSIQKTYELYYFLFSSVIAVADYAEERIAIGMNKHLPTQEEALPNRKFVENDIIALLRSNIPLSKYCEKHHFSWAGDNAALIRDIYNRMIGRDYYKSYLTSEERSFDADRRFLKEFFSNEFEDDQALENMLEEKSVWWSVDDINYVIGCIIRTLDSLTSNWRNTKPLSQEQCSQDDEDFAKRLLRHSLIHYTEYWDRAIQFVHNWEADRVAAMDTMLIVQGFSEAIEFSEIPVRVTINEYVEIAKYYSTNNSHVFVNGVLDRMIKQGIDDGLISKIKTVVPNN